MPIDPIADLSQLTDDEVLVIEAIADGTYFPPPEVPVGDINGVNLIFTLDNAPNPVTSLKVYLGGIRQIAGGVDFILSGVTITFNFAPPTGIKLIVDYTNSPI